MAADALAGSGGTLGGVADRWELLRGDDGCETGSLFISGMAGGCSLVWLPPERMTTGRCC
jgi:hypothetical protein